MAENTAVDPPEEPPVNTEAPQADQRAHARINVHWQCAVVTKGQPVFGRITDLSRGGLSFMCESPLAINAQLLAYIRMPNNTRTGFHELETVCKVANSILVASQGHYRMGMRIVEMRGNSKALLTHYLASRGG